MTKSIFSANVTMIFSGCKKDDRDTLGIPFY